MREVLFKNLTSLDSRKKDIILKDAFEKDGVLARTERRCFYYIKNVSEFKGQEDIKEWAGPQDEATANKRHFHILKEHNDALGEDKLICKIAGEFYAIVNSKIYTIAFLHSFKVTFMKATLAK